MRTFSLPTPSIALMLCVAVLLAAQLMASSHAGGPVLVSVAWLCCHFSG